MDPRARARRYLEHLTRVDRDLLVRRTDPGVDPVDLTRRPERVEELLADPAVGEAVLPSSGDAGAALVAVSPFLAFAVAVHRSHAELAELPYVEEWTGPRQRLPVFATHRLRAFLDDPDHRLFLAELLASYTRVAGGAVTARRHGVVHRRSFSELDPAALAGLLEVAAEEARPGVYRRLGDLALFLTGVFPDHTARRGFAPVQVERLARALHPAGDVRRDELLDALAVRGAVGLLEQLGQRWYRLAVETAGAAAGTLATVGSVADRFVDARRVLNHLTDRHLFPARGRWFPSVN